MKKIAFVVIFLLYLCGSALARNVSYVGGWVFMEEFNDAGVYGLWHYTVDPKMSFGVRQEYFREEGWNYSALQFNYLAQRFNFPDAQANLYVLSNMGGAYGNGADAWAGSTGLAADWENRNYFISYENRYLGAKEVDEFFLQKARVGFAPYVAEFGGMHTWLMLEAGYSEQREESLMLTPLMRFFRSTVMAEVGWTIEGGPLVNLRLLF